MKLIENSSTVLEVNKKETKRKESFQEAIVTTGGFWISFTDQNCLLDFLKRPFNFKELSNNFSTCLKRYQGIAVSLKLVAIVIIVVLLQIAGFKDLCPDKLDNLDFHLGFC